MISIIWNVQKGNLYKEEKCRGARSGDRLQRSSRDLADGEVGVDGSILELDGGSGYYN